jgi:selenocysteine-specific elongation factor
MKHVILGTAGHIDHGKTALVKALTGVDTDRLKEEKERGITIELGFTFLDLPSGTRLGIVDVPGHERFVKHMVAGAWGIDLVALVIAADEGVMPQTREHLDICSLLKVKRGLVVLTKIDLVESEFLDLVREEVKDVVHGTFLRDAPILPVSSVTGEGISDLVQAIDRLSEEIEEKSSEGLVRLPIDRVFVMKGFGTVVTGTMVSGSLSVGETVEILPSGLKGKIRNMQVYNQAVETAFAGQRTAVNLQGIETAGVERGNVLVRPDTLVSTQILDAWFEYLTNAPRPLKHRARLRFHVGTNLTIASVFLLEHEDLKPGDEGFVQVRLDRPILALPQDHFVIRDPSAVQTLGGGVVLDPHPFRHKRHSKSVIADLRVLKEGNGEAVLRHHILRSEIAGTTQEALLNRVALSPKETLRLLRKMRDQKEIRVIDTERMKVIDVRQYARLREMTLSQLGEFHQRFPMKSGLAKEELRTKLPKEMDVKLFQTLLNELAESKEVVMEKDKLMLPGHRIASDDEKGLFRQTEEALRKADLQPPSSKELADEWSADEKEVQEVLEHLAHKGVLIKIRSGMYFHREGIEHLKGKLVDHFKRSRELTTPQFKEITGVSRKFTIPLIEYFDQIRFTLRLGDKRILRAVTQGSDKLQEG